MTGSLFLPAPAISHEGKPERINIRSGRAGIRRRPPGGFLAFIPAAFPPTDLTLEDLADLLEKATPALGRLVGSAEILPNPDLFVLMYVRREAVLSSQIEGTEASLVDLLEYEAQLEKAERRVDVREIANYVAALRYGMERIEELPLSLRLIREIHRELLTGARGGEASKTPGEVRRSQNWIGGPSPATARFVPPPPAEMAESLHQLEAFLHADSDLPLLIRVGLAHAFFETIHPFLDGNGRVGRLLITFFLVHKEVLREPILYLSIFFKRHRQEVLRPTSGGTREGRLGGLARLFPDGCRGSVPRSNPHRPGHRCSAGGDEKSDQHRARTSNTLGTHPSRCAVSAPYGQRACGGRDHRSLPAGRANALTNALEKEGILVETTGRKTYRMFQFDAYLRLFTERDERH